MFHAEAGSTERTILHPMTIAPETDPAPAGLASDFTGTILPMVQDNPFLLIPAGILALLIAVKVLGGSSQAPKDPSRLFSAAQRLEGFTRAGDRCEMESMPFIRCRKKASHGDHWYPWSKGGATSMDNFVAACASCNTSKGAKVPTAFATLRLEKRRHGYFPTARNVAAGQKFAQR